MTNMRSKKAIRKMDFVKASTIEELQIYKDCVDLDRLFLIKGFRTNKYWIPSWILWIYTLWHMKRFKADVVHIDWQFNNNIYEKFLFKFILGKKKIMTVHDPIMHSGQPNAKEEEKKRVDSFKWADHLLLLNKIQKKVFADKYSIDENDISISQLTEYDSISKIKPIPSIIKGDYILFFGSILPYKGLEYLLEAMIKVHEECPNLKLIVAGGGKIYFDIKKFENLDYIKWVHRYVSVAELAGFLKDSKFVVCPYKDATQSGVIHTAFAMGIPVIATNVGALSLDIKEGINGLLVPPCNVDDLALAILKLVNNSGMLESMHNNILNYKLSEDKNHNIADEYIKVYEK